MNEVKNALLSRAVWGGCIAILAGAIKLAGYDFDAAAQAELLDSGTKLTAIALDAATVLGGLLALIGRVRATKRITKGGAPAALLLAAGLGLGVSGCAGMPQNDCLSKVAATEIAVTQGYETTVRLVSSGVIDKEKAKKVLVVLDAANVAVDNAAPLCRIDHPNAGQYLAQAAVALAQFATLTGEKK